MSRIPNVFPPFASRLALETSCSAQHDMSSALPRPHSLHVHALRHVVRHLANLERGDTVQTWSLITLSRCSLFPASCASCVSTTKHGNAAVLKSHPGTSPSRLVAPLLATAVVMANWDRMLASLAPPPPPHPQPRQQTGLPAEARAGGTAGEPGHRTWQIGTQPSPRSACHGTKNTSSEELEPASTGWSILACVTGGPSHPSKLVA